MSDLAISPTEAAAGTPFIVTWSPGERQTKALVFDNNGKELFSFAGSLGSPQKSSGEFTLFQPGAYTVAAGADKLSFLVTERKDLSFIIEFFLWGSLVLIGLGGLLWKNRRTQKT